MIGKLLIFPIAILTISFLAWSILSNSEAGTKKSQQLLDNVNNYDNISMKKIPWVRISEELEGVGLGVNVALTDNYQKNIEQYPEFFKVTIDFSKEDLSRIDPQTLQIYSSPDGINWTAENTTIDFKDKTAVTSVKNFGRFTLTGKRLDIEPPVTQFRQIGNTFVLFATDNYANVDYILYRLDGDDWEEYKGAISVGIGDHTVRYYSVDNHENIEEEKISKFTVK